MQFDGARLAAPFLQGGFSSEVVQSGEPSLVVHDDCSSSRLESVEKWIAVHYNKTVVRL